MTAMSDLIKEAITGGLGMDKYVSVRLINPWENTYLTKKKVE